MLAGALDLTISAGLSRTGFRDRLRDATSAAHRDLDARLSAFDLTGRRGYRRFLQASAGALLPLEAALVEAGVAELFPDWPARTRSAAIRSDLGRLGSAPTACGLVSPLTRSGIMGTMYVLEGSRLGAKFLLATVASAGDPRIAEATSYLCHGAGQRLWQSFLTRLAREPSCDEDEAIDSARAAFAAFERAADRA
jgi:heme oxygenase (biliverdin-IX-beta and delta-forming)